MWLEGFLAGDAVLLLHEPQLLGVIDGWVTSVQPDVFDDLLPLLRRTFSEFAPAERRAIGEKMYRSVRTMNPARSAGITSFSKRSAKSVA